MRAKDAPLAQLDVGTDDAAGEFTALVSVFGNVDAQNERVLPGAFTASLERWAQSGAPIPVVWAHQWKDPFAHIGVVAEAAEIDEGLLVKGALDLENPTAVQVRHLMVDRRVRQFSFAYDILDAKEGDDGVLDLAELELFEVGPTLVGANPLTELVTAKAEPVPRPASSEATPSTSSGGGRGLALMLRLAGLDPCGKAAVASHSTPTSTSSWDAGVNENRVRTGEAASYYRKVYAWQDPEADAGTKAGWRFIHHELSADGTPGAANLTACSSSIAILNGGRGGTTIPAADRQGVYNHVAKHLRDGDKEPPALA